MNTEILELQQVEQLQEDNRRLRRINDLQARTIDQADRALLLQEMYPIFGYLKQLRHIVQRWEQLRELLTYTPAQRN